MATIPNVTRAQLGVLLFFRDRVSNLFDVLPKTVSLLAWVLGAHANNFEVAILWIMVFLLDCTALSTMSMAATSSFTTWLALGVSRVFREGRFAEA